MISYNPPDYGVYKGDKFYADLLASIGINSGFSNVVPFIGNFDFACPPNSDFYFDIGDPTNNNYLVGNLVGRTLYHGSLNMTLSLVAFVAGAATAGLATGPNSNLQTYSFFNDTLSVTTYNNSNHYNFENVAFNYLRWVVSAGGSTYKMEGIFTGVKIQF